MKALSLIVATILFVGCSGKNVSISTPSVNNEEVKSAILMYKRAKMSKDVNQYAPEELYKATKIVHVLTSQENKTMATFYARLLKKQVKIAELTTREYTLTHEVNDIITKRNEAIEDAKHQQTEDADEETTSGNESGSFPELSEIKASFGGDDNTFLINGKYFDNDEIVLNSKLKGLVGYLANYLRENNTKELELDSYTDGIGSEAYSVDMSLRRANRIKEELVDRGVDENRIKVNPKGAVDFIGSNDSDEGREKNNRIVIKIK